MYQSVSLILIPVAGCVKGNGEGYPFFPCIENQQYYRFVSRFPTMDGIDEFNGYLPCLKMQALAVVFFDDGNASRQDISGIDDGMAVPVKFRMGGNRDFEYTCFRLAIGIDG